MAIAIIIATATAAMYISVGGCAVTGCGDTVDPGALTTIVVSALDGQ
jgi:hypothetical protein